ncbi:hypothetical protein Daus18300_001127 [Diaporthe australafricana]|uniref:2EXR domain-containing protein n=1 Tax=Diaporthe australafricana TaxID=127596 RepID=A0ABR3XZ32_9PEZI
MADTNPPQPNEDVPLPCLSNSLPQQLPEPAEPSSDATPPDKAAPRTFHLFSDLPPELRITIWELTIPRRVHVLYSTIPRFNFAAKPPVIAHVCAEARSVAFASGSIKRITTFHTGLPKSRRVAKPVWVDSKRDTAVHSLSWIRPSDPTLDDLHSLLIRRGVRIALDRSWAVRKSSQGCKGFARKIYYELIHGHEECDCIILTIWLYTHDEESAATGLFDNSGTDNCVLVPIEDKHQMSRLFAAQAKFPTRDGPSLWADFTEFRKPTNLFEYIKCWEQLAAREIQDVQTGWDWLMGVQTDWRGKDANERREQAVRIAASRAKPPKLRPVIMVLQTSRTGRLPMGLKGE